MIITVLKSKLAYVKITATELFYEGSITIDKDWMEEANINDNEQVHIVNSNNGDRLVTYAIPGQRGSKEICLNGPAARNGMIGDEIIVLTYAQIDPKIESLEPTIVNMLEDKNR